MIVFPYAFADILKSPTCDINKRCPDDREQYSVMWVRGGEKPKVSRDWQISPEDYSGNFLAIMRYHMSYNFGSIVV